MEATRNLSRHIDLYTHTGSAFVTVSLTFWHGDSVGYATEKSSGSLLPDLKVLVAISSGV